MKNTIAIFIISFFTIISNAQNADITALYTTAMHEYGLGHYKKAAKEFQILINNSKFESLSTTKLYNGACIFSLAKQNETAIKILDYLAFKRFYPNYEHITTDTDLNNIHSGPKWKNLIKKVAENKKAEPERLRKKIKTELFKAKEISGLLEDGIETQEDPIVCPRSPTLQHWRRYHKVRWKITWVTPSMNKATVPMQVRTEFGKSCIEAPKDRQGSFEYCST